MLERSSHGPPAAGSLDSSSRTSLVSRAFGNAAAVSYVSKLNPSTRFGAVPPSILS
jgi:hypothetical protein